MLNKKTEKTQEEQINSGKNAIATGLSLVTVSIFLYFSEHFIFNNQWSHIIALLLCGLGTAIISTGIEFITKVKTTNIGVGAIFISIWGIATYFFDYFLLDLLGVFALWLGMEGVYLGIIEIIEKISKIEKLSDKIKNIVLLFTNISSLILIILQIIFFNKK